MLDYDWPSLITWYQWQQLGECIVAGTQCFLVLMISLFLVRLTPLPASVSFAITFAVYFILLAFWSNEQERKIMTHGLKHVNKETLKRIGCCSTWHLGIADGFLCILLRRNFFYFALLFCFNHS
jgi:hypothetical protein